MTLGQSKVGHELSRDLGQLGPAQRERSRVSPPRPRGPRDRRPVRSAGCTLVVLRWAVGVSNSSRTPRRGGLVGLPGVAPRVRHPARLSGFILQCMPAHPGDSVEFSQCLRAIAQHLDGADEVDWAERVRDIDRRIARHGYDEGRVADAQRQFAHKELDDLRASSASASAGVGPQVDYAVGWIAWLQRARTAPSKNRTRASRFPPPHSGGG